MRVKFHNCAQSLFLLNVIPAIEIGLNSFHTDAAKLHRGFLQFVCKPTVSISKTVDEPRLTLSDHMYRPMWYVHSVLF